MKASNTDHYRVKPVYGFVDARDTAVFEITRSDGAPRDDKFVVQYAAVELTSGGGVEANNRDAESAFKNTTLPGGEITLPIKAVGSADRPTTSK